MPEMLSVSGAVKSINGNTLIIETGENPNPFEQLPSTREIAVTQSTKIVRQDQKNPEEFQTENEEYQKKLQSGASGAIPPVPTIEMDIKLSDIKVNDFVTIVSDKNIKNSASFEAVKVIFHQTY